jgi:hypothetical protein
MSLSFIPSVVRTLVVLFCSLIVLSCEQYEYTSPEPGIVEIRLKTVNNRQDLLPFSSFDSIAYPFASMVMSLNDLVAIQPNDVRLTVFSDLHAIRRNPDGDFFDTLSPFARDSIFILGQAYAPPQTFTGLDLNVTAPFGVQIFYGAYSSFIIVDAVRPYIALQQLTHSIPVESGRTTRVTVAFDMDASLIQLTESFLYLPVFYVSSVEIL